MINRKHLFFRVFNLAAGPKPLVFVPFGECYTDAPYTIAGLLQQCIPVPALLNVAPHVEAAILVRAIV